MNNQMSEFSKRRMQRTAKEKREALAAMESQLTERFRDYAVQQDYVVGVMDRVLHTCTKFSELDDPALVHTGMCADFTHQEETGGFVLTLSATHNPYNAFEPDQKRVMEVEVVYDGPMAFPSQPTSTDLVIGEFINSLVENPDDKVDILVPVVLMVEGMLGYDMQITGNLTEGGIRKVTFARAPITVNLRVDTTIQRRVDKLVHLSHLTDGLKEKTDELMRELKEKEKDRVTPPTPNHMTTAKPRCTMNIHTDQELKNSMYAMAEAQVATRRRELADLLAQSRLFDEKTKQYSLNDYSLLHGALTDVLEALYKLPAQELMMFSWRYELVDPNRVGDLGVRLKVFHNHRSTEDLDAQLLSVTVKYLDDEPPSSLESDDVDMEEALRNVNADEDSLTIGAESVIWSMGGYLEEVRLDHPVSNKLLATQEDGQVMMGYRLGKATMFIQANFEVLDTYEDYCEFLGRTPL